MQNVQIDAKRLVDVITRQRNAAHDEIAMLSAVVDQLNERVAELEGAQLKSKPVMANAGD